LQIEISHRLVISVCLAFALVIGSQRTAAAQLSALETNDVSIVYLDPTQGFLAPQVARSAENALDFHRKLFDFRPTERITVLLTDFADFGNAAADSVPHDTVTIKIAPLSFAYETFTANERMNYLMNHELAHVATSDRAAARDRRFRRTFLGKVAPVPEHPESIGYFFLTSPRRASPRWYLEGIAVFLDTWMAGGIGRAQGPYDEMVFRSMVASGTPFYDPLGLSSQLTKTDFRLEANSYLYGTRFMSYLAYRYSPEQLMQWVTRSDNSRAYYASQFRAVYGVSIEEAWRDWIAFEQTFQESNLAAVRRYPTTPYRDISTQPLGSLSRAWLDTRTNRLYAGVNHPGTVGYVAAISLEDGSIEKLHDIKQPRMYTVTSLAWDAEARTLFYTADNTGMRDLIALDPATKRERVLMKDARIGDLVLNRADRSLWGIRAFNGICTLVRIPPPYTEWIRVYSWPYGETAYDLDLSADGTKLSVSVGAIDGRQTLRLIAVAQILSGDATPGREFDFGPAIPSNFVFSPDGRYLFGSSYYTGVSNIFRFDVTTGEREALTNAETGFFQPMPTGGDSFIVFRYSGEGFVPARIDAKPLEDVASITFLGERLVEKHPVLKTWIAGSPGAVPLESMVTRQGPYKPLRALGLESLYPVVEGYKTTAAFGAHLRLSDPLSLNGATLTASYSPAGDLESAERLHLRADYRRYDWRGRASWNDTDFYDLFGPTRTSRKGYSVGVGHTSWLVFDEPRRMQLNIDGRVAGHLDQLPEYQNVPVAVDSLVSASADLNYSDVRSSLGNVDDEKGRKWSSRMIADRANGTLAARAYATYDFSVATPMSHSSVWLRTAAGFSPQDPSNPFANFYFGGFGNNYVDYRDEKRYREYYAFPGVELNAIGGRNFVKSTLEWNMPPVFFRRAGTPSMYLTWLRPAIFAGGLMTNLDRAAPKTDAGNIGGQADLRLSVLSTLDVTVSLGGAVAFQNGIAHRELMASVKILR
jgi:hypothetical protein